MALAAALAFGSHKTAAEALLLIDADTGKVLHAVNATNPWYPASVTKLMTAYLTLKAVKDGRIALDTLFTVSPNAVAQAPSKMGFPAGIQVTVDNALKMMMVKSANDVAVVLAEGVSGSIERFAEDMNKTAQRLGMMQSHFVNPNGLPDDGQISSARDLAIVARALLREFPEYDIYWRIPAIKFGRRLIRNTNKLITAYPGTDGMKTGFICASGFNVVATATRGDKRLIAVVLGAPSSPARAIKAAQLLERGFASNPLSWLTPSGTVDALAPVDAMPMDMHDSMCGKRRKRPATEDSEDEVANTKDPNSPFSILMANLRGPGKDSPAVAHVASIMAPIVVYTGPTRTQTQIAALAALPLAKEKPARRGKGAKPRKGEATKTAAAKQAPSTSASASVPPAKKTAGALNNKIKPPKAKTAKQSAAPTASAPTSR